MVDSLTAKMKKQKVLTAIMVECLPNTEENLRILIEHVHIAYDANVPFYLIDVTCEPKEHEKRVKSYSRAENSRFQPGDVDLLRDFANNYRPVDPTQLPKKLVVEGDICYYTLDATDLAPLKLLQQQPTGEHWRSGDREDR